MCEVVADKPDLIAFRTRSRSDKQTKMAGNNSKSTTSSIMQSHTLNAEQIMQKEKELIGEFPQTFSHTINESILRQEETPLIGTQKAHQRHDSQPEKGMVAEIIGQLNGGDIEVEDISAPLSKIADTILEETPEREEEEESPKSKEIETESITSAGSMGESAQWLRVMRKLEETTSNLNSSVQNLQGEISLLRSNYDTQKNQVGQLEHTQKQDSVKLQALISKIDEHEERINMLINTVVKQDETITSLQSVIYNMQAGASRRNLIFYSIVDESKEHNSTTKENPAWTIAAFLKNVLQLNQHEIVIENAFRLGGGVDRPILAVFKNFKDKQLIMQKVELLKGKTNKNGKAYFISEQLPEKLAEDRKQHYYRKKQNRDLPSDKQLPLTVQKNQLYVGDKKFETAIQPITPAVWLRKTVAELNNIDHFPVIKGATAHKEGSFFISYAAKVSSLQEVQTAYNKIRRLEPEATHVMCAYRLPGLDFINLQSFLDDGEHGAGRLMLDMLYEERSFERAVFVVRYYGGVHLGAQRFKIITQLAKTALDSCNMHIRHHAQDMVMSDTPAAIGALYTVRTKFSLSSSLTQDLHHNSTQSEEDQYDTVDSDKEDFITVSTNKKNKTKPKLKNSRRGAIRGGRGAKRTTSRPSRPSSPDQPHNYIPRPRLNVDELLGTKLKQPSIINAWGTNPPNLNTTTVQA